MSYTLDWQIDLPEFDISMKTFPKYREQEMIFLNINYWEGGIDAEAVLGGGEKVKGQGFTEILGVMANKEAFNLYLSEAKEKISELLLKRP